MAGYSLRGAMKRGGSWGGSRRRKCGTERKVILPGTRARGSLNRTIARPRFCDICEVLRRKHSSALLSGLTTARRNCCGDYFRIADHTPGNSPNRGSGAWESSESGQRMPQITAESIRKNTLHLRTTCPSLQLGFQPGRAKTQCAVRVPGTEDQGGDYPAPHLLRD